MAFSILLIGLVSSAAIYWQVRLFSYETDMYKLITIWDFETPNSLTPPFAIGTLTVVGSIAYGPLALLGGGNPNISSVPDWINLVLRCVVFTIVLVSKSYFGPLVTGYVLSSAVYSLSTSGVISIPPIFEELLNWVFFSVPLPIQILYSVAVSIYAVSNSIDVSAKVR